jgi:hypothetical protein
MQELLALPKSEASQSQPVDSSPIWPAVNRVKCGTLSLAEFFDPTGSWNNNAQFTRSAYRYGSTPGFRDANNGFRVVCELD